MSAGPAPKSPNDRSLLYPAILSFAISGSIILLQLVQTRIYSVVFWNHLVYFIVSVALMGFGISGTWLAFGRQTRMARLLTPRVTAIMYSVTALVSSVFLPQLAPSLSGVLSSRFQLVSLLVIYVAAILPYFFGGWLLGSLFTRYVKHIHLLYFADLIGAALGCALYLQGMQPLGAVTLIAVACAAVAVPVLSAEGRPTTRVASLAVALACFAAIYLFEDRITQAIRPDNSKAFMALYQQLPKGSEKVVELTEWNTISRIDVVSATKEPHKRVFIDGDAWTGLAVQAKLPAQPYAQDDILVGGRAAYFFRPKVDSVLVLGTGGGIQVYEALRAGASYVDAVEINPTTQRLPMIEYRDATNDLMYQPGVNSYCEEGRSFIRRAPQKYDVIAIHGIDTFAALNAGAYMLAENYLYTTEAIEDYFGALSEDGILVISRWYHYAETPRLFVVALESLIGLGVSDPASHIVMHMAPGGFATLLVGAQPFNPEKVAEFRARVESANLGSNARFIFPRGDDELVEQQERDIAEYVSARAQGKPQADAYLDSLDYKIAAVSDDSPFFFHFDRMSDMFGIMSSRHAADFVRGNWASFTLVALLLFSLFVVVTMMLLPLMRRGRPKVSGFAVWLIYFSSIGVSFIFIEIVLMQRFALLLGHPSRSLALVLASLLFSAGVGSYARNALRVPLPAAIGGLLVLIVAAAFLYPHLMQLVLPYSLLVRGVITVALVAPLGFFMGMPFPSGLAGVSRCGEDIVPWMWGINGATTVLGSILAIALAIPTNFTVVLMLAAVGYGLTLLAYLHLSRRLGYSFEA